MSVDAVLLESPTMRARVADQVEVLDRVRALMLLPDGVHVTTEGVAAYFGVGETVIKAVVFDHRQELVSNGYRVVTGGELGYFKQLCGSQSRARSLALFTRRAVLNVAMLLRDSETARQVRCYLLDAEQGQRAGQLGKDPAEAVDKRAAPPDGSVDAAVARVAENVVRIVIATAVVPILNVLVEEVANNSRKLDAMNDRVGRLERIVLDDGEKAVARRRLRLMQALDEGTAEDLAEFTV
ncbi:hypothetical protein [Saccharothrix sp. ST-888]|uniref:hypothetical protein n=1 Tax=Saccharothrix sp. ST-888 TaxID=1427391 RepID=UPI0005EC62B7|nr:hypothetical protein [Saccharothrix sp. ST-888]